MGVNRYHWGYDGMIDFHDASEGDYVLGADFDLLARKHSALIAAAVVRGDSKARCLLCDIGAFYDDPDPAPHRDRCPLTGDIRDL